MDLKLDTLEQRRLRHVVSLVQLLMDGNCHPALSFMFQREADGSAMNKQSSRTGAGRRHFSVFAKEIQQTLGMVISTEDSSAGRRAGLEILLHHFRSAPRNCWICCYRVMVFSTCEHKRQSSIKNKERKKKSKNLFSYNIGTFISLLLAYLYHCTSAVPR